MCLAMYAQTNVGLLCFVGSGSNEAAVYGVGLRPLACWDCGFELRQGHGMCMLCIVQVEVSATGQSLVLRSPSDSVCH